MKKWLIYDYYNRKESFKMYKKIIKSNNQEQSKKAYNRMFILHDLGMVEKEPREEEMERKNEIRADNSLASSS